MTSVYQSGDTAFFERLLANPDGEARNAVDLAAALRWSLAKRDWPTCRRLLDAGADPGLPLVEAGKATSIADSRFGPLLAQCRAGPPGRDD